MSSTRGVIKSGKHPYERVILVCVNERPLESSSCGGRGSVEIAKKIKSIVKERGLSDRIRVTRTLCFGLCEIGPNIAVFPDNVWYNHVKQEDVDDIIKKYVDSYTQDNK